MAKKKRSTKIKQQLSKKPKDQIKPSDYLSTGSTLLNLACTRLAKGGLLKGKYYLFCGDSGSGKTWINLTILAEASINKNFDDYRFIYDDIEDGALMDKSRYFGEALAERLEPPARYEDGDPKFSQDIQDLYYNIDDAVDDGRPFIYIVDSMDGLTSEEANEKFEDQKKARRAGRKTAGSYGDGKAKKNSTDLRRVVSRLRETGSILIIIAQTRDNLGFGFKTKTRSGGRALKFYATLEIWSAVKGTIKKTVKSKKVAIGTTVQFRIEKNRVTGRDRTVEFPIYYDTGIDDVGSCIDFLIDRDHFPTRGKKIKADCFEFIGTKEKLIEKIEEEDLYQDLQEEVEFVWEEIEKASQIKRKNRYA